MKSFDGWLARYGGMSGSEVRRTKDLEATLSKLERIVARQALELEAAKEIIKGKY